MQVGSVALGRAKGRGRTADSLALGAESAVVLRSVTKSYDTGRKVLDGIDLVFPAGSFTALVGSSGCGKTTILNMLAGIVEKTSGDVEVLGLAPSEARPFVGYMLSRDALLPWRNAIRNVEFGLEARGVDKRTRRQAALNGLRDVELADSARSYTWQLSQGMRQRVALARTFVLKPRLLLMDEPFAALDALTRIVLQQQFLELWEQTGSTVVFVTHDLAEAVALAGRVVVLGNGSVVADISVPFDRPRDLVKLPGEPKFQQIYRSLWDSLSATRST